MLIGHWPLLGNVTDYAGRNDGTAYNLTYSPGKIGSSAYFDGGTSPYISLPSATINNLQDFTFAFWSMSLGFSDRYVLSVENTDMANYILIGPEPNMRVYMAGTPYTFSPNIAINTWNHFIIMRKDNSLSLYLNGVHLYTHVCITTPLTANGGVVIGQEQDGVLTGFSAPQAWYGNINDFRIYNHALSLKEIKELAKAKILDYSFNTFQEYTVNRVTSPFNYTSGYSYSLTVSSDSLLNFNGLNTASTLIGAGYYARTSMSPVAVNGIRYTTSWYLKTGTISTVNMGWGGAHQGNRTTFVVNLLTGAVTSLNLISGEAYGVEQMRNGFWKIWYSSTLVSGTNYFPEVSFGAGTVIMGGIQIEEKSHATQFTTGTRAGIVTDNSGYRNDALLNSYAPQWTSDSKLGTGSYIFNNTGTIRNVIQKDAFQTPEKITMLIWFKASVTGYGTYHIPFSIKSSDFEISVSSSGVLRTGYSISGTRRIVDSSVSLLDGQWHLIGSTFDGQFIRAYKDGILVNTAEWPGTIFRGSYSIGIGQFADNNNYGTIGQQDGAKIYATALSADDILELYNTHVSVDKIGNLWTDEIVEDVEIQNGLTLRELFEDNKENLSNNTWLANSGHILSSVTASSLTQTMNIGITSASFYVTPSFTNSNVYYYWFEFKTEDVSLFDTYPHGRYFETASYQNLDAKSLYENNKWKRTSRVGAANNQLHFITRYAVATTQNYVNYYRDMSKINLTTIFGSGAEPSQAQMDAWYDLYFKASVFKNGSTHAREFIENDTIAEASKFFKDTISVKHQIIEN